jgi:hypothetical protein
MTKRNTTDLTDEEESDIAHALGVPVVYRHAGKPVRQARWSYRNYFDAGGDDVTIWEGLARRGFAVKSSRHPDVFHVTEQGVRAASLTKYVKRLEDFPKSANAEASDAPL